LGERGKKKRNEDGGTGVGGRVTGNEISKGRREIEEKRSPTGRLERTHPP